MKWPLYFFYWIFSKCFSPGFPLNSPCGESPAAFPDFFYFIWDSCRIFLEQHGEVLAQETGRYFQHGRMLNTRWARGKMYRHQQGFFFIPRTATFQRRASFWVALVTVYQKTFSSPEMQCMVNVFKRYLLYYNTVHYFWLWRSFVTGVA